MNEQFRENKIKSINKISYEKVKAFLELKTSMILDELYALKLFVRKEDYLKAKTEVEIAIADFGELK